MTADKLLTSGEAAALLQPHLRGLDAFQWLVDTRRTMRRYNDPARPPRPIRKPGGKKPLYRLSEIQRVIEDLGGEVAKPTTTTTTTTTTSASKPPFVILGAADQVRIVLDGRLVKLDPDDARRLAGDLLFASDRIEAA